MTTPARIGYEPVSKRALFVIEATRPNDVGVGLSFSSRRFACLLAWDATSASEAEVTELAKKLLKAGCCYFCCWGPGCERVHDLFDSVDLELRPDGPVVMSTWHADESLSETLWFLLFNTYPDDAYFDECGSAVGIALGTPAWANEMRDAFSDPQGFSVRGLASEEGAA